MDINCILALLNVVAFVVKLHVSEVSNPWLGNHMWLFGYEVMGLYFHTKILFILYKAHLKIVLKQTLCIYE